MNAIAYCRVSTLDQSVYSIDSQQRRIKEFCASNNLTLVGTFEDNGESSYTFDRPDYLKLEAFIKSNKNVQYLIVSDHDRFSRNLAEALMKFKELQDKYGVKVLATTDSIETDFSDPSTFMIRAFKYMMAESELWRIRERTKSGMVQAALNGRYVSQAPMGYINTRDSENKPLLKIDEDKAFIVRMIFKEYNSGKGIEEVRRIVTPYGFTRKGSSAIQEILSNPVYAGLIRIPAHKGKPETIGKAVHKAIISEADYWRANQRLNEKKITKQKNEEVPLRGVLKCHICGRTLTAGNSKGRNKYYWYYLCETHRKNLPASKIHQQLNEILDLLSLAKEDINWLKAGINKSINEQLNQRADIIAQSQKALRAINDKISIAEENYLLGDVSKASYTRVVANLRTGQIDIQKRILELEQDGQYYYDKLNFILPKIYDIRGTVEALGLLKKQQFLNMVFDNSLMHDGEVYRTAFIHPMFAHNLLKLKEKRLLIIEQPSFKISETPISAPYKRCIEPINDFIRLYEIFAA